MSAALTAAYPEANPPSGSPAAGTYTATWNGTGTLVNSVTSGGRVLSTHAGVLLASLACPPPGVLGGVVAAAGNPAGTTPTSWAAVPC
jgi:hypothetical protein